MNPNPQTELNPQNLQNLSFDKDKNVLAIEMLGFDGTNLVRLKTDSNGVVQTSGGGGTTTFAYQTFTNDQGILEKGSTVTSTELNWTKNKTTVSQSLDNGVGAIGANVTTYTHTDTYTTNRTYTITGNDGTNNATKQTTISFVYPYYYGVGAQSLSAANVALLTKSIIASTATLTESFTTSANVPYFAYPASYGTLTSIKDPNNFEVLSDWTLRVENITGLDTTAQSYNIYEFNNPTTLTGFQYTFKR